MLPLIQTLALLERTPATVSALLRGLPDCLSANEGGATWSAFDIAAHYLHCEPDDWMPRIRLLLEHGTARPFAPFDREGHRRISEGRTLDQLLDDFTRLRRENLAALDALALTPADLDRPGLHPALGPVTLGQLLATWAAHDLNHLHQLARVLAHPYRDAVGPFAQYLGVLHCHAHGA